MASQQQEVLLKNAEPGRQNPNRHRTVLDLPLLMYGGNGGDWNLPHSSWEWPLSSGYSPF